MRKTGNYKGTMGQGRAAERGIARYKSTVRETLIKEGDGSKYKGKREGLKGLPESQKHNII